MMRKGEREKSDDSETGREKRGDEKGGERKKGRSERIIRGRERKE